MRRDPQGRVWLVAMGLVGSMGCSDDRAPAKGTEGTRKPPVEADADVGASADGCDAIELEPPHPGQGVQIVTEMTLEPGEERQTCKLVMTGEDINYNYGEGLFTPGSHHATVWRTSYSGTIPTTNVNGRSFDTSAAVDCLSSGDWRGSGVITAGHSVDSDPDTVGVLKGSLPADVAFKISADEVLLMNFHMANLTGHVVHACYKQNLPSVPAEQVKQEAGMMFFYNQYIAVPASGTATADMACPVTADITVSTAVSHMHRRGTGYTASLLDGDPIAGGNEVKHLDLSGDWNEPPTTRFDPPLPVKAGQWIRWACEYQNTEQRNVAQGQQTTDEMCMFVGTYWPRNAAWDRCGYDGAGRNFGTGTMDGTQFVDCWNKSAKATYGGGPEDNDARYASQRCITETCPRVSALINDYLFRGKQDILTATCD